MEGADDYGSRRGISQVRLHSVLGSVSREKTLLCFVVVMDSTLLCD